MKFRKMDKPVRERMDVLFNPLRHPGCFWNEQSLEQFDNQHSVYWGTYEWGKSPSCLLTKFPYCPRQITSSPHYFLKNWSWFWLKPEIFSGALLKTWTLHGEEKFLLRCHSVIQLLSSLTLARVGQVHHPPTPNPQFMSSSSIFDIVLRTYGRFAPLRPCRKPNLKHCPKKTMQCFHYSRNMIPILPSGSKILILPPNKIGTDYKYNHTLRWSW